MSKRSIFRTELVSTERPTDPEGLFRDLKGRSPAIRHLWSHQADLLREYSNKHKDARDIAFELPTGTGKTLVGLLIGEFRRRSLDERIVYLCPTRQLARQVGAHAKNYGIHTHVFIGKQIEYPSDQFNQYQLGQAIAITTYSGLFNTNPKINDPQTIIFDDAHAGESYICSLWSVEINRKEYKDILFGIADIFKSDLPSTFIDHIKSDDPARYQLYDVDLLPGKCLRERAELIRSLIETHLEENTSAWYSWQMIRDHLHACNLFLSWESVLLRPIIPPVLTHEPVTQANQRVYMSATLGAGGELERITGIPHIERLPIPPGWEKQGTGRRLFIIPELSFDSETALQLGTNAIEQVDRALVLVPDRRTALDTRTMFDQKLARILGPADIEDSLEAFTSDTNVILILANRYDGLDLPDDSCRLLIVRGLPGRTNLQESFLLYRLGASSLLRDRMLTRFTQAVGRCTRSDTDYAAVFLLGNDLLKYVLKKENRCLLHPELQAEIQFGIDNSEDKSESELKELLPVFLKQGEDWEDANTAIIIYRNQMRRMEDSIAAHLRYVVRQEVEYLYDLWKCDYKEALIKARSISDALGGEETKGYRGWWYYLTGDVALLNYEATSDPSQLDLAKDFFRRASRCSLSISWFAELSRLEIDGKQVAKIDELTPLAVESVLRQIDSFGLVGRRFEEYVADFLSEIEGNQHDIYQRGLKKLGELLGFEAEIPSGSGTPDCLWSIRDIIHIAHEVKTEQKADSPISIGNVRQAAGHSNWVRTNLSCGKETRVISLIESPRRTVDANAIAHASELYWVEPNVLRKISETIVSILRSVRAEATQIKDETLLEHIRTEMESNKLLPDQLFDLLKQNPVKDMQEV